jgi:hypothetical protein
VSFTLSSYSLIILFVNIQMCQPLIIDEDSCGPIDNTTMIYLNPLHVTPFFPISFLGEQLAFPVSNVFAESKAVVSGLLVSLLSSCVYHYRGVDLLYPPVVDGMHGAIVTVNGASYSFSVNGGIFSSCVEKLGIGCLRGVLYRWIFAIETRRSGP